MVKWGALGIALAVVIGWGVGDDGVRIGMVAGYGMAWILGAIDARTARRWTPGKW